MAAGLAVSFEAAREEVIHQVASALVDARIVSQGLYNPAKVGREASIVDVAVLIGWFTSAWT